PRRGGHDARRRMVDAGARAAAGRACMRSGSVEVMGKADLDHLTFSLALHRAVAGAGNSCFSPYSVASALGLTSQASRGAASEELVRLLAAGAADIAKQADLLRAAATLTESGRGEAPVLEVANTLWTAEELTLHQDFLGELAAWPNGGVRIAPFAT